VLFVTLRKEEKTEGFFFLKAGKASVFASEVWQSSACFYRVCIAG
jgi:hypothetical protein